MEEGKRVDGGISGERVKRYLAGKRRYSPTGNGEGGEKRERESERRYVEKGKKASRIPTSNNWPLVPIC
jgi:hypothetical protein